MSITASTITAVQVRINDDTDASGLLNAASPALVRHVGAMGDAEAGTDRSLPYPYVLVDVNDSPAHAFEGASTNTYPGQGALVNVRVHAYTDRDQGRATMSAVMARLRARFSGFALDSTGGWLYSRCMSQREIDAPSTDKVAHMVLEFQTAANRSS